MYAAIPFPEIDPALFSIEIGGVELALRWYALAYIVGIVLGWRLAVMALRRPSLWPGHTPPLSVDKLEAFLTWAILGVIIGGRLGFVLFYRPGYYLANPLEIPAVWQGGMAFHGGFLGVVIAAALFCRRHGVAPWGMADLLALATPPGLLLGRIANFINGELWGRPTDVPWGVIFPDPRAQACGAILEGCARHPSQLYEAALEGLVLGLVLIWMVWRRGALKVPGLVVGVFLAGYGLGRYIVEFFRQADPQYITPTNPAGHVLGIGDYGVTMGQLLSLPMLGVGVIIIALAVRRRPV